MRSAAGWISVVVSLGLAGCSHAASEPNPSPEAKRDATPGPTAEATVDPTPDATPRALPDALFQHWVHSFEDDGPGVRAYRPRGYAFPPARGREGFRLERDGRYVLSAIARGDGNAEAAGTWKRVGADTLEVKAAGGEAERLQILSVTDGLLKVRAEP